MIGNFQLEELDQLLNELEQLAVSDASSSAFLSTVLQRLRFVFSAEGAAFVIPILNGQWRSLAISGAIKLDALDDQLALLGSQRSVVCNLGTRVLATLISADDKNGGAILVTLGAELDQSAIVQLTNLSQAFGEVIANRETAQLRDFLTNGWSRLQSLLASLTASSSLAEAATLVVHDLPLVLSADRVSLAVQSWRGKTSVLAVTGASRELKGSKAVSEIQQQCSGSIKTNQPIVRQTSAEHSMPIDDGVRTSTNNQLLAPFSIALPLRRATSQNASTDSAILIEWYDFEKFLIGAQRINTVIPCVAAMWGEHQRWLRLPRWTRWLSALGWSWRQVRGLTVSLKYLVPLLLAGAFVWMLTMPTQLRIEMEGVLEPESQRTIFADMDGVVEKVLVTDNSHVKQGQLLAVMKSQQLEIAIQEILGELRANAEKLDALSVSVNQLAQGDAADASAVNRISAEIRQLETQRQILQQRLEAYRVEEKKLELASPIDGIVVARDLENLLDSRPVRRGDALLRVVNPNGPWRVNLWIADRDVGYVRRQTRLDVSQVDTTQTGLSSNSGQTSDLDRQIEFVLASTPDSRYSGKLVWLAAAARNPRGEGVFVDARAEIDSSVVEQGHMGATVHAYLNCGQQPTWFVWSRPLIEAIQRKLWFSFSQE